VAPNYNPEKGESTYLKFSTEIFAHHCNALNDAYEIFALLRCHAVQIGSQLVTDVSGQTTSPTFRDQAVQSNWTAWLLKMRPIGCSETTDLLSLTPRRKHSITYDLAKLERKYHITSGCFVLRPRYEGWNF